MPLTPQDVHSKVFGPTRFRRGYDEAEVDAFLDEVEAELTRLHEQIDALRGGTGGEQASGPASSSGTPNTTAGEAQAAAASLSGVDVSGVDISKVDTSRGDAAAANGSGDLEQRVARTLVLAQRAADEALRDAETHAEQVRAAAEAEAERVRAEAEEAASRERASLESERSTAEDDVEQLRAFEREYRTRLRAYLELQLRELDGSGTPSVDGGPAPALAEGEASGADAVPGPDGRPSTEAPGTPSLAAGAPETELTAGGVSHRAAGEEQSHEPPRHGV